MPTSSPSHRRPGRLPRATRTVPALALGALVLTGCEESRFGMPNPASEQGEEVLRLWQLSFYGAVVLGALVAGLLLYSLIRHRRRDDSLPKQTEGSVGLELTYTIIPFILVGLLFAYGLKAQEATSDLPDDPDISITATGFQWNWQFDYEGEDVKVIGQPQVAGDSGDELPTLVLPVDRSVKFTLVAADVAHSFFVPGFLTKRDLIPGIRNEIEVTPNRTGLYMGHCAEYCGLNHSAMNFRVRIVPQAEYDTWLQQEKGNNAAT